MNGPAMCATCALRPGTEAASYLPTQTHVKLCILSGEQFDCHEREGACAGWRRAVQQAKPQPEWKRELAGRLLEIWLECSQGIVDANRMQELVIEASQGIEEL